MGQGINRLTAMQARNLNKAGYYADGAGLYLSVKATGAKSWIFRYRYGGREREMGLGSLMTFGLAEARQRAMEQRKLLADGKDPLGLKRTVRLKDTLAQANAITFDQAAAAFITSHKPGWKNAKHASQWTNTLATYVSPVFGKRSISEVDTALVMRVLVPIWQTKTETASRVRGRIEKVLDWAKTQGYRIGDNPAIWRGHLENLLAAPKKTSKVKHHPALPWREVGGFMEELRKMPGISALALQLIILTNCRTTEAIKASWAELYLEQALWTIPAERTKASKEHVIPLSWAALEVLRSARSQSSASSVVFPGGKKEGAPLSNMACLSLLKRMGRTDVTVHGFRSTFRDWAGENTAHPREVIEHAMAHGLKDKAEAAYARGSLLDKRRVLMNDWAAYCAHPYTSPTEAWSS
jgi:integrase